MLDLVDDTYVAVDPRAVARAVHDERRWGAWWPGLRLTVTRDRGPKGVRLVAEPGADLPARTLRGRPVRRVGSLELWLEPWGDGTVVHHCQRLDPVDGRRLTRVQVERLRARRARAWKHRVHALKDELEASARVKDGPQHADNEGR